MRHLYKKFYSWNTDIAYITGLIASDGCLVNDNRHLNITSKDIEIINNVKNILNIDVKVSLKTSSYGGEAYNLQFSDVALYDFLLDMGLTPAKSFTMSKLGVPDEYYADFLRGYFDGDGTFYGYWDKRWKNSLMYYTEFSSASVNF
jgi:intein/homing endonuclease